MGPRTFQNSSRNIINTIGCSDLFFIHDSFDATWYFDISRAFERTIHMTISSTLKFTNTLPYAWKYHRIDSTGVSTGSTQQRSTWVQYFRTKTLQVRSDSTENKLNPIQFLIYYNVQFAKTTLLYINEMFELKINNSKPKGLASNSPYNS